MYSYKGWHFPDLDSHFQNAVDIFPQTTYQQLALETALKYVKTFDTAIDAGANIGLQSVRISKFFSRVYAFEPTSLNFECLYENTKNIPNIIVKKIGLGDQHQFTNIHLPKISNNCGAFSIVDFVQYEDDLYTEEIEILQLDSFELIPNFIKIDTQGFELCILKGSKKTLQNKPVLLIECEKKNEKIKINEFLTPLGYKLVETVRKDTIWICE